MAFEDGHHLVRIANALWTRAPTGKAAVLVGAGFSANARPLRSAETIMPGWTSLVIRMVEELHPGNDPASVDRRAAAIRVAAATSAALRIAQEYESEFGRDGLDRLITDVIPDEAFGPGDHHRLLLDLPWADVLTTNWDTLLERGARDIEDRVYRLVQTVADIPSATGPRIVKLHGSLPSHRPFIFTEEDFRTYPERFAPFVNMARQTTMENVLVLLGFSGDDPNFLYWSGWVRDQLGDHAPIIYLVGSLDLSPSQRKMLERRRIQPVDLAKLPLYETWPEAGRKSLATRWVLETLSAARPYPVIRWPSVPAPGRGRYELIPTVTGPDAPVDLPAAPYREEWADTTTVESVIADLRHNRELYPGWLVAGHGVRDRLWRFLLNAIPEARTRMPDLPPNLALALAFELNWLSETALAPFFSDLSDPVSELLPSLDRSTLTADEQNAVIVLALALLRRARETGDVEAFAVWEAWIESSATHPDHRARLAFERCLLALDGMDYDLLDERLSSWKPDGDPFWLVRKAALLAENDRQEEARALSKDALVAIRVQTDRDSEDIGSWSREAYALLFRSACVVSELKDFESTRIERDLFSERLLVLAGRGCPAQDEVDWFNTEMHHAPPAITPEQTTTRGFDVGTASSSRHWTSTAPIIKRLAALQALRFYEETGTPARIAPAAVAASAIAGAGRWLHTYDTSRAIGALVRSAGGSEKHVLDIVFSREAVAALDDEDAALWGDRLLRGAASLSKRIANPQMAGSAEARLNVVLEMLSRLVVRRPALAIPALELALEVNSRRGFRSAAEASLKSIIRRAYRALPLGSKPLYRRRLLETPTSTDSYNLAPADAALQDEVGRFEDPELRPIVATLLTEVRHPDRRWGATLRLQKLSHAGALSDDETASYVDALWDSRFVKDGLPAGTAIRSWAFALMDHPKSQDPGAAAKAQLLSWSTLDNSDSSALIRGAVSGEPLPFRLGARELKPILAMILVKAVERAKAEADFMPFGDPNPIDMEFWRAFQAVVEAALGHNSTRALVAAYFTKPHPVEAAISAPALLAAKIIDEDRTRTMLAKAWAGEKLAPICAAQASFAWLDRFSEAGRFPEALWSLIADTITARSPDALLAALDFIRASYARHPDAVPVGLDDRVARALEALLAATEAPEIRTALTYDPGAARKTGARLIAAMKTAGRAPEVLVETWRRAAAAERIPEIGDGLESGDTEEDDEG